MSGDYDTTVLVESRDVDSRSPHGYHIAMDVLDFLSVLTEILGLVTALFALTALKKIA